MPFLVLLGNGIYLSLKVVVYPKCLTMFFLCDILYSRETVDIHCIAKTGSKLDVLLTRAQGKRIQSLDVTKVTFVCFLLLFFRYCLGSEACEKAISGDNR